jgi:putative oxygen-independent coproporphyrinogen III oxidase
VRIAPACPERPAAKDVTGEPALGVYVHWPFCRSKCPYCDFNSHVRESIDQARWRSAYLAEIDRFAEQTLGRRVGSVFFGGGTPSLMDPATTTAIIERIQARWRVAATLEVTLEANPSSAEAARFRAFRDAGVNRLSVGIQALDDDALRFLGRGHSAQEARRAAALAAAIFPRHSIDLIWGWPGHSPATWRHQLTHAVDIAGEHLSAYQLTIEPGTAFWRDGVPGADEDVAGALFDVTQEVLATAGLPSYEISNHARPGGACRHNLSVWQGADYLGIGPGAHGRITLGARTEALRALKSPEKWLARLESGRDGIAERGELSQADRFEELLLMGLRLTEGIARAQFRDRAGVEPEDAVASDGLARLIEGGFIAVDEAGMRATPAGRVRLNAVLAHLLT